MKAAVFHGPGDVRFEEISKPVLEDGEVLIRVRACGICGSDLHTYRHGMFLELGSPIESGRVLGHEFSGEIAELGGDVSGARIGDRVISIGMGGNAEYVKISSAMNKFLIPLSESVSFEEGATTEPLATSLHGVNLAKPADDETHVIMGAGIIGLGVLQGIKHYSSAKTIVVDLSDKRLAMASTRPNSSPTRPRDTARQTSRATWAALHLTASLLAITVRFRVPGSFCSLVGITPPLAVAWTTKIIPAPARNSHAACEPCRSSWAFPFCAGSGKPSSQRLLFIGDVYASN